MNDTHAPAVGRPDLDGIPSRADLDAATAATAAAIADPAATVHDVLKAAEAEEALFQAARATGWQLPEDRPLLTAPQEYVTEVSVPSFGDGGYQALHSRPLREPEPEPGMEIEI
jgi:hypothetical protein